MSANRNPQAEQMADESMVRNLAAQARAIWPQERAVFAQHPLPEAPRILDVGCGTGEITRRLAELFPQARLVGADLEEGHLSAARLHAAELGDRVRFERADAFELPYPDGHFDLAVNRHMLQAVPEPWRVLAEMVRVTRPGGRVHVLAEDYAMIQAHPSPLDSDAFWRRGPIRYGLATGTDLLSGRKVYPWLHALGVGALRVDYVVVDTARVDRALFAEIWEAWRDGYTTAIARHTELDEAQVRAHWADMLATIRDPGGYLAWLIPVITGTVPGAASSRAPNPGRLPGD